MLVAATEGKARDVVRDASRAEVESALRRIARGRLARGWPWLARGNPYRVAKAADNLKAGDVDPDRLAEYIAASCLLHSVDGWAYASQALEALASGRREVAIHVAYYAELRAALAILATEGIGVFNTRHFGLRSGGGSPIACRGSTHEQAWLLLQAWGDDVTRVGRVLEALQVDGASIGDWLDLGFPNRASKVQTAAQWLRAWSIDLREPVEDRNVRNMVSYRPWGIREPEPSRPQVQEQCAQPIVQCWEMLQPNTMSASVIIDAHLLRLAVDEMAAGDKRQGATAIDAITQRAGPQIRKLFAENRTDVFKIAGTALDTRVFDPSPILFRAVLLLRLASALVRHLFNAAGIRDSDLEVWLARYGIDSGIWDSTTAVTTFSDLWADVELALDDFDCSSIGSIMDLVKQVPASRVLTQLSRVPLWLLAS